MQLMQFIRSKSGPLDLENKGLDDSSALGAVVLKMAYILNNVLFYFIIELSSHAICENC